MHASKGEKHMGTHMVEKHIARPSYTSRSQQEPELVNINLLCRNVRETACLPITVLLSKMCITLISHLRHLFLTLWGLIRLWTQLQIRNKDLGCLGERQRNSSRTGWCSRSTNGQFLLVAGNLYLGWLRKEMRLGGLSGLILIEAEEQQGLTADNGKNVVFTWRLCFSVKDSGWELEKSLGMGR